MIAGLASCVFLWGLQYKLSLYESPQAPSHHVPMAKLLSRNEESDNSESSTYTQSKPPSKALRAASCAVLFILLIACIFCLPALNHRERLENVLLQLRQALLESFFVRPPPVLS
jgi:hypothetical protein